MKFDLAGGPVTGTAAGEDFSNTPSCTFDDKIELTFAGTYDPALRKLSGTVDEKFTEIITRGPVAVCNPAPPGAKYTPSAVLNGGNKGQPWEATLSDDGQTITGKLLSGGSADRTFVLRVQ